jgi:hypothetical protein
MNYYIPFKQFVLGYNSIMPIYKQSGNKLLSVREKKIDLEQINWELADYLSKFEPYGQANPEPLFMSSDVLVSQCRKVGADAKHCKLELIQDDKKISAIAFGFGGHDLAVGHRIDIVYNININQWNGNREIQIKIKAGLDFPQHILLNICRYS